MPTTPSSSKKMHRFRANPVEVAIVSVTALVFVHSAINLFNQEDFSPVILTPLRSKSTSTTRNPSSIPQTSLETLTIRCAEPEKKLTVAGKVRLNGSFCGLLQGGSTSGTLLEGNAAITPASIDKNQAKAVISNLSNQYDATVFADLQLGRFSTDYIPLNTGENKIHIELTYAGKKLDSRDLIVQKN